MLHEDCDWENFTLERFVVLIPDLIPWKLGDKLPFQRLSCQEEQIVLLDSNVRSYFSSLSKH